MSYTAPNPVPYRSLAQTDALPAQRVRRKFPLPPNSAVQLAAYALDQDFEMFLDGQFPPAPKNTTASDAAFNPTTGTGLDDDNAILTGYSQPQNSTAGMGKFTATFSIVPASWDDIKTMPFTPPGFVGAIGSAAARDINPVEVNCRLRYDYFLVDPDGLCGAVKDSAGVTLGTLDADGSNRVSSASLIPRVPKSNFVWTASGAPVFSAITNSLVPSGGIVINGVSYVETFPTVEDYQGWITNADTAGWDSDIWNGTDLTQSDTGQLVIKDSWLEPYAGNIWARITPYVLAR